MIEAEDGDKDDENDKEGQAHPDYEVGDDEKIEELVEVVRRLGHSGEGGNENSSSGDEDSAQSGADSEGLVEKESGHQSIEDEPRGLKSAEKG